MPEHFVPPEVQSLQPPKEKEKPKIPTPEAGTGILSQLGSKFRKEVVALGIAGLVAGMPVDEAEARRRPPAARRSESKPRLPTENFFDDPEFSRKIPRGEFSKEERARRTEQLRSGVTVLRDVGLTFYLVQPGDSIEEIREKLARIPEFRYLLRQRGKLESFNIPAQELQAGMWLPVPIENKDRQLNDERFKVYAREAVRELRRHPDYESVVEEILNKVSEAEVVAAMVAIAKQESGGLPLGQFELHRWEPHHNTFSFSMFHVLMKGPGLRARRNLEMTEGQLYHPENAAKLFIAFIAEKCDEQGRKPAQFFPINKHLVDFAVFYNGRNWRRTNPHYVRNVGRWYKEALPKQKMAPIKKRQRR